MGECPSSRPSGCPIRSRTVVRFLTLVNLAPYTIGFALRLGLTGYVAIPNETRRAAHRGTLQLKPKQLETQRLTLLVPKG
jgi:hypothetical protein